MQKNGFTEDCVQNTLCAHNNDLVFFFAKSIPINIVDCIWSRNFVLIFKIFENNNNPKYFVSLTLQAFTSRYSQKLMKFLRMLSDTVL